MFIYFDPLIPEVESTHGNKWGEGEESWRAFGQGGTSFAKSKDLFQNCYRNSLALRRQSSQLSSSKQLGAWHGIVWNVAEGWLCLNSWRIWNIFLSVGVPMVVSHAISLIKNLWRYLYFGYTLLYFLGGGYVLYYGGKMEQDSGAFPEQTTSPISSSFPLLIKELLPKNKFNHRNEKMKKWRKTAKQDKIIIV